MAYGKRIWIIIIALEVTASLFLLGCKDKPIDHYNLGISYAEEEEEYDQAISEFTKAIEIESNHVDSYVGRGEAYLDKLELDQAISDYTKAIQIDPMHAAAYRGRGTAYSMKNEYALSISDYDEAIKIDPMHADAYSGRGIAHSVRDKYDQAILDPIQA